MSRGAGRRSSGLTSAAPNGTGETGRERFLRRLLVAGMATLAFALVAALLVGCGDDDDDPEGSEGVQTATAPSGDASPTATRGATNDAAAALQAIEYPVDLADGMAIGNADATATLELWEDFQCPFCLRMTVQFEDVMMEYVEEGNLRVVFRNFPILGDESVFAAAAAVCAAEQDRFWEYHNNLFLVQAEAGQMTNEQLNVGRFDPDALVEYAGDAGLDEAAFAACLQDPATITVVQEEFNVGRQAGINSTPTLVLNDQRVQTPQNEQGWRQLLDEATQ